MLYDAQLDELLGDLVEKLHIARGVRRALVAARNDAPRSRERWLERSLELGLQDRAEKGKCMQKEEKRGGDQKKICRAAVLEIALDGWHK